MDNTQPILVVGGTGKTGRRVAARLQSLGVPVRIASRSGTTRFDWYDRGTWPAAVGGAGAAYVAAPFGPGVGDLVAAFATAAADHRVGRVVLMTGSAIDRPDADLPDYSRAERVAERAVQASGVPWTVVRANWFMQNFSEDFFRPGVLAGQLRLPAGDGALPLIDADDIAAVAVAALTGDGHAGRTHELSGPRSLTFAAAAAEVSRAIGRPVRYVPISRDEFAADLAAHEMPPALVEATCDLFESVAAHWYDRPTDGVARVLGRPPTDFSQYVRAAAASGAWNV